MGPSDAVAGLECVSQISLSWTLLLGEGTGEILVGDLKGTKQ